MRELIELGFEVTVVADAPAAANYPELGDGYAAALTNFRYVANAVLPTEQVLSEMASEQT